MPIPKRTIPKPRPSQPRKLPTPERRKHNKLCAELYNRLQADPDDFELESLLRRVTKRPTTYLAVEYVLSRADSKVETLQINSPDQVSYRTTMTYTDRTKKPIQGYLYPSKTVVKTSRRMVHSAILAYIELCKHVGRFI